MSYKHLEDIQNIYEQISEPVDKQLVSEASAILIDSMFSEGYSEDAIAQYALNASPDDIAERIAVAAENYIYIEASQLNESIDGVEYEILEENSQKVANLQELVEKAIIGRALGALGKVLKPAAKGIAASGKLAGKAIGKGAKAVGKSIKGGAKALVAGGGKALKSTGDAIKKYGPTAAKFGAAGLIGVPLAIGAAKLAGKGIKTVGKFIKGGTDAFKKDKPKDSLPSTAEIRANNQGAIGGGNAGASTDSGGTAGKSTVTEPKAEIKKPSTASGKELPKPRAIGKGKGEINPNSARGQMIAKNKEIHGGDKIKKLRDKNAAFQAAKKSGSNYSMDDFVKDFPDSNTAKDRRKSKKIAPPGWDESYDAKGDDNIVEDRYKTDLHRKQDYHKKPYDKKGRATGKVRRKEQDIGRLIRSIQTDSYDAFDIVSNYLIDSKQVENMDEALYVMSEMDAKTIQGIVEHHQKDADGNTVPHE